MIDLALRVLMSPDSTGYSGYINILRQVSSSLKFWPSLTDRDKNPTPPVVVLIRVEDSLRSKLKRSLSTFNQATWIVKVLSRRFIRQKDRCQKSIAKDKFPLKYACFYQKFVVIGKAQVFQNWQPNGEDQLSQSSFGSTKRSKLYFEYKKLEFQNLIQNLILR